MPFLDSNLPPKYCHTWLHLGFLTKLRIQQDVLVIKDKQSGYVRARLCKKKAAQAAYDALLLWFYSYGICQEIRSDGAGTVSPKSREILESSTSTQVHITQNPTAEQKELLAVTRKHSERGKSEKFKTSCCRKPLSKLTSTVRGTKDQLQKDFCEGSRDPCYQLLLTACWITLNL